MALAQTDTVHLSHHEMMRFAYRKYEPDFLAMPAARTLIINVDVPAVFALSLAKFHGLGPLYDDVRTLRRLDQALVGSVEERLYALGQAQSRYSAQMLPASVTPKKFRELRKARGELSRALAGLHAHGLLPGTGPVEIRWPTKRINVAFDVSALVTQFRDYWHAVHDKTTVTLRDLDAAEALAQDILHAVGARQDDAIARVRHIRRAAFTLFDRAWDELRRGISYIRWHEGDLELLAPSIYANRLAPGKKSAPHADDDESPFVG